MAAAMYCQKGAFTGQQVVCIIPTDIGKAQHVGDNISEQSKLMGLYWRGLEVPQDCQSLKQTCKLDGVGVVWNSMEISEHVDMEKKLFKSLSLCGYLGYNNGYLIIIAQLQCFGFVFTCRQTLWTLSHGQSSCAERSEDSALCKSI